MADFNQQPAEVIEGTNREIFCFSADDVNIDRSVVQSFGEEWEKFHAFSDVEIERMAKMYFDILDDKIISKDTYGIDIGCGTGRWTKYLLDKVGFIEAVDPSDAIFTADKLLGNRQNVRLSKASTDNLPFADETFDFGMSVGVLHHIPDTQRAMSDCVKKVKKGGHFYVYLYYSLENRSIAFKSVYYVATGVRKVTSSLPPKLKRIACDVLAVGLYMPFVMLGRGFNKIGLKGLANKLPLHFYQNQSFFVIRNDSLDRFGTTLEHRYSRAEITTMMQNAGLEEIVIADTLPYWHAVGKRVR